MKPLAPPDWVTIFQRHLLAGAAERLATLSPRVRDAFLAVPRHLFVEEYCTFGDSTYHRVDEANLLEHLPALYRDEGLGIFGRFPSGVTIAAPGWVLTM